jgi:hypothetical protein
MRVLTTRDGCHGEDEMVEASWEPFMPPISYSFYTPINWVGFYVSAQYRDASSNISPVMRLYFGGGESTHAHALIATTGKHR